MQGKNTLYIDLLERSANREMLQVNRLVGMPDEKRDELLAHISYQYAKTWNEAMSQLRAHVASWGSALNLVVLDAGHWVVKLSRRHAREQYLKQGFYYMGEEKIKITDPENFSLRGYMYDTANQRLDELLDAIITAGCDVMFLLSPEELSASTRDIFTGYADSVLVASFATDEKGRREWFLAPTKFRGRPLPNYAKVKLPPTMDVFAFLAFAGTASPEQYAAAVQSGFGGR
jgi:hypothetical protein